MTAAFQLYGIAGDVRNVWGPGKEKQSCDVTLAHGLISGQQLADESAAFTSVAQWCFAIAESEFSSWKFSIYDSGCKKNIFI